MQQRKNPTSFMGGSVNLIYKIAKAVSRRKAKIEGIENLKEQCIILSNHITKLDHWIIGTIISDETHLDLSILSSVRYRWLIKICGYKIHNLFEKIFNVIFIHTKEQACQEIKDKIYGGNNILLFPEGSFFLDREKGFRIYKFKTGAIRIAQETQIPIILCKISHSKLRVSFSEKYHISEYDNVKQKAKELMQILYKL